ncbi:YTH domain-containing protein 1-like [Dioscorea cayenensis subsp. rotundata]|uniref:YTH domain-containing protein 1-like n=1 Tax=Dioscorea cayennensis subsp. rotundata TaxID=55577 RepID=A0AB40BHX2_DIOCR|nr:YTH domain-containing protein 1-like [Dioscorea cayenensis subsp. rotundata]
MRIRRNASRLVGSALCQPWLSCPAPLLVDPPPPPPLLCHLNRSPWDVSPLPSEEPPSPDPPFLKFNGSISGRTHSLVQPSASASTAAAATAAATARVANVVQSAQKSRDKINGKKQRRRNVKNMANANDGVVVEPMKQCGRKRCSKSDGKGWHCKKPAHMPHSLCRYHLAQLRAYNASYRVPGKPRRRTESNTGSDFYYYSGFGPWRAKRRSGGGEVVKKESVCEVDECNDNDDHVDDDGGGVVVVYDDDDDDDDEEEEEEEEEVAIGVSSGKRGRKRIKARSLKSLL